MPKRKNEILRKWVDMVDPEVALLSLLIVQTQLSEDPYPAGHVRKIYLSDPDRLLDLVEFPDDPMDLKEAWKNGDWQAIGAFLGQSDDPKELPTARGWPT